MALSELAGIKQLQWQARGLEECLFGRVGAISS